MEQTLCYGVRLKVQFSVPDDALVAISGSVNVTSLDDCETAAAEAVLEPIDYPAIFDVVMPGDQLTIAVGPDIPKCHEIVSGIIFSLAASRHVADDHSTAQVVIVCPPGSKKIMAAIAERIPPALREQVEIVEHDPNNRKELAYLAASFENKPIYLNRRICDAGVVIALGAARSPDSFANWGIYSSLYPTFADAEAIDRFLFPKTDASSSSIERRKKQIQEAAWQLGARFFVQVIPGPKDDVLAVLAGDCDSVAEQSVRQFGRTWNATLPQKVDLAIGAISGRHQSWKNLALAIHAASAAVDDGGAIVICSDLAKPPTAAFQMLASGEDSDTQLKRIQTEQPIDGLFAALLLETLERRTVYLMSQLDTDVVEAIGMTAVNSPDELTRLCSQYSSCALLESAQLVTPTIDS